MDDEARNDGRKRRRRVVRAVLGFGLLGCALVGLLLIQVQRSYGVGLFARPFRHEGWTAPDRSPGDRAARRARMLDNLMLRQLELGTPRAEIEALLGPGDSDSLPAPRGSDEWMYQVGATPLQTLRMVAWAFKDEDLDTASGFESAAESITVRALRLRFDERERLASFEIVEL